MRRLTVVHSLFISCLSLEIELRLLVFDLPLFQEPGQTPPHVNTQRELATRHDESPRDYLDDQAR